MARPQTLKVRVEVELVPKGRHCPCAWSCHSRNEPCSFTCIGHHGEWQAVQLGRQPVDG